MLETAWSQTATGYSQKLKHAHSGTHALRQRLADRGVCQDWRRRRRPATGAARTLQLKKCKPYLETAEIPSASR